MRLLLRFGFFFILAGLVLGLLLRRSYPERTPEAVVIAALPWAVHLSYSLVWVVSEYQAVLGSFIFGFLELVLAAVIFRFGPRLYRRAARRAALLPLLLLAGHVLLLSVWVLFTDVSFGTLPNLYFVATTLFVSAGLLTYGLPLPKGIVRRR